MSQPTLQNTFTLPILTTPIPTPTMTTIRPINFSTKTGTDYTGLDAVFRATSGSVFKPEPTATIAAYIYCHQYPAITPGTCFVLEAGSGEVVGYILGTASTGEFATRWRRVLPGMMGQLGKKGICAPPDYLALKQAEPKLEGDPGAYLLHMAMRRPNQLLNAGIEDLWQRWPGHFHINILPGYQRQGWGRRLMETMLRALEAEGCKGVHLGMEAGNEGTEKFYGAMGFERYPGVLDDGVSGETGRTGGANAVLYLVKTL